MKRRLATLVLLVSATSSRRVGTVADARYTRHPAHGRRQAGSLRALAAHRRWPSRTDRFVARPGTRGDLRDESKVQAWARTAMAEHESNYYREGPHMRCLPQGPSYVAGAGGGGGNMRRIVQSPTVIAILNPDTTYRQIFTDGRTLEADPLPIWQGYSVGRWDGDTLVVESNGYNDKTWLHAEGLGHTEQLRITERYRRTDFGHMQVDVTYDDPGTFDVTAAGRRQSGIRGGRRDPRARVQRGHRRRHEALGRRQDCGRPRDCDRGRSGDPRQIRWDATRAFGSITRRESKSRSRTARCSLSRNGGEKNQLVPQSETTFVCPTCQWGQPYVFTREADGMATEVREVQVSGAWIFKRVQ